MENENREEMDHNDMDMDEMRDMKKDEANGETTLDRKRFAEAPTAYNDRAEENLLQTDTKNVTRLNTNDPVEMSVRVSQVIWPSTHGTKPTGYCDSHSTGKLAGGSGSC
ncbi:hypothetical protein HUR95_07250 [Caldalkalibacillus thermarum TA2.A1]|nr:hypothetical protein [Caldalkalibacillus thermarum]QZT35017.1 hypothetical protein HUR95_07250 [Caldalkalibacillus thermarum TA2.A1]